MKPFIEIIPFAEVGASYRYLKLEVPNLEPYWHYHPEIEISFVKRGSGIRFVGDNIAAFAEGDLLLLGENLPHDLVSENQEEIEDIEVHVIQFPKELITRLPECKSLLPLLERSHYGLHFTEPDTSLIERIEQFGDLPPLEALISLFRILQQFADDKTFDLLSTISYQEQFLKDSNTERIGKVNAYIIRNFENPLSLKEVAKVAGLTPHSFTRWFKRSFSCSFLTYLHNIRIEKACRYLLHTNWQVADIAYRTGFESISNFNRTFKSMKLVNPTTYRSRRYRQPSGSKLEVAES